VRLNRWGGFGRRRWGGFGGGARGRAKREAPCFFCLIWVGLDFEEKEEEGRRGWPILERKKKREGGVGSDLSGVAGVGWLAGHSQPDMGCRRATPWLVVAGQPPSCGGDSLLDPAGSF
jgi:hypothetical protein